jgi:DNA repair exonuclease SbcCD ATPase subunit
MKNIVFNKINFQNFLSVSEIPLSLEFKEGINIITGENLDNLGSKNGIGKTTILNFIFWIIFGETINDLKKSKIVNNKNKKDCFGTINFSIDTDQYEIIRHLEPASIKILKNNQDITLSTIEKNNDYIKNILNINQEVFRNSVILTSENTIPFMAQKKIDKRKFIEGVMNLNIFSEMLSKIRKDFNDVKKNSDVITALFSNEQKNLENLKKQEANAKIEKQNKINDLNKRINDNKNNIKDLQKNYQNIEETIKSIQNEIEEKEIKIKTIESKDLNLLNEKIKNFQVEKNIKSQKIQDLNQKIKEIKKFFGNCPTCKRPYSEKDSCNNEELLKNLELEIIETEKLFQNAKKEEKTALEKEEKIKEGLNIIKNKIQSNKNKIEELKNLDNKIKIIESKNEEIQKNINLIDNEKNIFDELIQISEKQIQTHQKEIKELYKTLDIIEKAKLVVSEEGVKTVIIKRILKFLNEKLNYYLNVLEAPCACFFDETFDTTIKTHNGKELDYWNLSGGERKRVDAATIFTFQDLLRLQTGVNFNLSMYDEWADSALDEKGMSKFLEILKQKVEKNKECIYIISHNSNFIKNDIDNIVFIQKKNGTTTIKTEV